MPSAAPAVSQVSADRAVVAGRDINARDIIVRYGLTEQEVLALVRDAREAEGPLAEKLAEFAQKLGITESAVQNFLRILGEKQVPPERLLETLAEIAQRHLDTVGRLAALQPQDPATQGLVQDARFAMEVGDYDRADRLLQRAETAELAAVGMAEELARQAQEAADRRRLNAAAILGERGAISLARLRYREAAEHFAAAAGLVPPGSEEHALGYLDQEASALYRQGDEFGDNQALADAIDRCRAMLKLQARERVPLDWAATQNNLGNALQALGEREGGTQRLQEAVEAYSAALEQRTRERVPLQWATTQSNLGAALASLGEREGGTKRLEKAVNAFEAALEEQTRARVPLHWAATQINLGAVLLRLGEREGRTERLKKAVEAFREALKVYSRELVPLQWAMAQNNLGGALVRLGAWEAETQRLKEAVQAYRTRWRRERGRGRPWVGPQRSIISAMLCGLWVSVRRGRSGLRRR